MEDSGDALDRSNDPGRRPGVPGESLVRYGSRGIGRRDLVVDALLVVRAPLVGNGQLGNPKSPYGLVRSRGRGGDSPRSRVGAVAGVDVVNQQHEECRPAHGGHKCPVANGRPINRGRCRDAVHLDD